MDRIDEELSRFSLFFSFQSLLSTEELALEFALKFGLIPSRFATPPNHCGSPMKVENDRSVKLGWTWRCSASASGRKVKGRKQCRARINPNAGTIFDCCLAPSDVLALVFCFVLDLGFTLSLQEINAFRKSKGIITELASSTVVTYFQKFRGIMEIINSHNPVLLGGEGKTVEFDETFLTRHKYHRGRRTAQMQQVIFGLHCREDKETLFFPVSGKSKSDLWPIISKYVHPDTSIVCTDGGKQYHGLVSLFSTDTEHLTTNHSIGEFVSRTDKRNTINALESQNKQVKRAMKSRRSDRDIETYISSFIYRQRRFRNIKKAKGNQIKMFLEDVVRVFPPYINGVLPAPLELAATFRPTPESEGIEDLMPSSYFKTKSSVDDFADEDDWDELFTLSC